MPCFILFHLAVMEGEGVKREEERMKAEEERSEEALPSVKWWSAFGDRDWT